VVLHQPTIRCCVGDIHQLPLPDGGVDRARTDRELQRVISHLSVGASLITFTLPPSALNTQPSASGSMTRDAPWSLAANLGIPTRLTDAAQHARRADGPARACRPPGTGDAW